MLAAAPASPRRAAVHRQRGEAEEPGQPGDGLHGPRAPAPAHAAAHPGGPGLRTGPRAARSFGPQILRHGLPGDARDPRADGGLDRARAALARGGLRPARGGRDGRRAAGRVLARLGPGRGRGRRRHAGEPARHAARSPTASSALLDEPSSATEQRTRGLEQSQKFDWDMAAARTLEFYRRRSLLAEPGPVAGPGRAPRAPGAAPRSTAAMRIGIDARELQGRPTGTGPLPAQPAARVDARRATTRSSPTSTARRPRTRACGSRRSSVGRSATAREPRPPLAATHAGRAPRPATASTSSSRRPTRAPCASTSRA